MLDKLLELYRYTGYDRFLYEARDLMIKNGYTRTQQQEKIEHFCETINLEDDRPFVDGEYYDSVPEDAFFCVVCNEYHKLGNTQSHELHDGKLCCDRALELQMVRKCMDCGKLFFTYNNYFNYERKLCKECYEKQRKYEIKRYHDTPTLEYYDCHNGQNYITNRFLGGYGVELEVDKGGESNNMSKDVIKLLQEEVYTMHDGSLSNGFEIITHPHTETALYNMNWEETFRWLISKGYRSHDIETCGLHLHISRELFDSEESIAKLVYFYNHYWADILKVSRRSSSRANRWAGTYSPIARLGWSPSDFTLEDARDIVAEYNRRGIHDMRYKAVNLQKGATVEIRVMRGTLNYSSFKACLDFMITTAKNSNKVTDVDDISQWLQGLKDETKEYLGVRKAFGYPPMEEETVDDCYNMTKEEKEELRRRVCAL